MPQRASSNSVSASTPSAAGPNKAQARTAVATVGGVPVMRNSALDHYVFCAVEGKVYRVARATAPDLIQSQLPGHSDVVTFPPGTYNRVFKDGNEIFPSDGRAFNDWVRSQECVAACRFRLAGKRPATLRRHFATCRMRQDLPRDPVGELCRLVIRWWDR